MLRAERRIPDLLISLCFVANKAMDAVISRDAADRLVARQARVLPPPPPRSEIADDVWRDAIAMTEAVANDRTEDARVLLANTPDMAMLSGCVLLPSLPGGVLPLALARLREEGPPPM